MPEDDTPPWIKQLNLKPKESPLSTKNLPAPAIPVGQEIREDQALAEATKRLTQVYDIMIGPMQRMAEATEQGVDAEQARALAAIGKEAAGVAKVLTDVHIKTIEERARIASEELKGSIAEKLQKQSNQGTYIQQNNFTVASTPDEMLKLIDIASDNGDVDFDALVEMQQEGMDINQHITKMVTPNERDIAIKLTQTDIIDE